MTNIITNTTIINKVAAIVDVPVVDGTKFEDGVSRLHVNGANQIVEAVVAKAIGVKKVGEEDVLDFIAAHLGDKAFDAIEAEETARAEKKARKLELQRAKSRKGQEHAAEAAEREIAAREAEAERRAARRWSKARQAAFERRQAANAIKRRQAAWKQALVDEIRVANDEVTVSGDLYYAAWIKAEFAVEVTDLHPAFEANVALTHTEPTDDAAFLDKIAIKIITGADDEFISLNNFDAVSFAEVKRLWRQGYAIQIRRDPRYCDREVVVGGVSPDNVNWYNTYQFSLVALWGKKVTENLAELLELQEKAERRELSIREYEIKCKTYESEKARIDGLIKVLKKRADRTYTLIEKFLVDESKCRWFDSKADKIDRFCSAFPANLVRDYWRRLNETIFDLDWARRQMVDEIYWVKKAEEEEYHSLGTVANIRHWIKDGMTLEVQASKSFEVCPNCGYEQPVDSLSSDVPVVYTLEGKEVVARQVRLCKECRMNDVRLTDVFMTVLHGLWAYVKDNNSCKGIIDRIRQFVSGHDAFEFCASQPGHPVGGFGVCLTNTKIIAAFVRDVYSVIGRLGRRVPKDLERMIRYALGSIEAIEAEMANPKESYMEMFAQGGIIQYFWIDEKFAIGHPHFTRTIAEEAERLGVPVKIVRTIKKNEKEVKIEIAFDGWHIATLTKGANVMVNHVDVRDSAYDNTWDDHFGPSRSAFRYYLFDLLLRWAEKKGVPHDRKAVVVCGLPGAGKSYAIRSQKFEGVCVDSDVIKWLLPEFSGGRPKAVATESRKLSTWVNSYLLTQGTNVVFQTLGNDEEKIKGIVAALKANGYSYRVVMVDTAPEICYERMIARKRSFGNVTVGDLRSWRSEIKRVVTLFGGEII